MVKGGVPCRECTAHHHTYVRVSNPSSPLYGGTKYISARIEFPQERMVHDGHSNVPRKFGGTFKSGKCDLVECAYICGYAGRNKSVVTKMSTNESAFTGITGRCYMRGAHMMYNLLAASLKRIVCTSAPEVNSKTIDSELFRMICQDPRVVRSKLPFMTTITSCIMLSAFWATLILVPYVEVDHFGII